jgi:hypothetical protein
MNTQEPLWVWIVTILAFLAVYTGEFIYDTFDNIKTALTAV